MTVQIVVSAGQNGVCSEANVDGDINGDPQFSAVKQFGRWFAHSTAHPTESKSHQLIASADSFFATSDSPIASVKLDMDFLYLDMLNDDALVNSLQGLCM